MEHRKSLARWMSWLLVLCMVISMLPVAALAEAPTTHNFAATVYKTQVAGTDPTVSADTDQNIYVSIDLSADSDRIYSVHSCSDPDVGDPVITKATDSSNGLIEYSCSHCGAEASVEIPMISLDAFSLNENDNKYYAVTGWKQWLGTSAFSKTVDNDQYILNVSTTFYDASFVLGNTAITIAEAEAWTSDYAEQDTGTSGNPVYMYVDYTGQTSAASYIGAYHICQEGAALEAEIVKATATTDGYVKYTCDTCGAYSVITVPALPASAFVLSDESAAEYAAGVNYDGHEHTAVYLVDDDYQRFVGTTLTNNVSLVDAGSYTIRVSVNNAIYDNVVHLMPEQVTIDPRPVVWDYTFDSKIYDGLSLLNGVSVTYTDVNGDEIPASLTVYPATIYGEDLTYNSSVSLTPTAAGAYYVIATITDSNYIWQTDDGTYRSTASLAWILPSTNSIYVGDSISTVTLNTGTTSLFTWAVDTARSTSFDSSEPGTTQVAATMTFNDGTGSLSTTLNVAVIPRSILSIYPVSVTDEVGTPFSDLALPTTVSVSASGADGEVVISGVPVTWDSSSYDSSLLTQTVVGTLDLSDIPELSDEDIPRFTATINLTYGSVETPTISPVNKVYDGQATALSVPASITGVASMTVTYAGTSYAGTSYSSDTPPVNAGSYTATVTYTMEAGYSQLSPMTVSYIISKADQETPTPELDEATTSTLTCVSVNNAVYSLNGTTWQTSPTFRNLDAGTSYTVYMKLNATDDGNYNESAVGSATFSTTQATAEAPELEPQTYVYTGNPISYVVPSVDYVTGTTVAYIVDGAETTTPPTNAGTYAVIVSFTMQSGAAQLDDIETTLIIDKATQSAPPIPTANTIGVNQFVVTTIPNAVYSIDGTNWQTSPMFEDLDPNTDYQVFAKYPADENHYESPTSSTIVHTKNQSTSAGNVESAVYIYDGQPKTLVADQPTGCSEVVQTFEGTGTTAYASTTTAPTNPGTYKVAVSYVMEDGYDPIQTQYANLTILKAAQNPPLAPVVIDVTDSSITIETRSGEAYSIDGGRTWSTTGVFTGLDRDTTYTIQSKALETDYYKEQEGASTEQKTLKTVVEFPTIADQTYEYDGNTKTFTLPKTITGISSMEIAGYNGSLTEPYRVGDYTVTITFTPASGYELPDEVPTPVLHIIPCSDPLNPVLKDETVTYTGEPQRYHGADDVQGITSVTITYVGSDGTDYGTSAPTNAGTYTVTAAFVADEAHVMGDGPFTAQLIIKKAQQEAPIVSLESADATSLTASAIPGAEYSIDGGATWQDSNVFENLNPCTSYTILVRMQADENHEASATRPVVGSTTAHQVTLPTMADYTTTYNGNGQAYPYTSTLSQLDGVKTVEVMYFGTLTNGTPYSSAEAPVNAGEYAVRFYLTSETNYVLSAETADATMTILRAAQTLTDSPVIANRTTTTIAVNPVPGAEYSIDGGQTWQSTPKFTGLDEDTAYTVQMRLAATDNYEPSNVTSTETKTVADTGFTYTIDYHDETIHFDDEVVRGGNDYTMTDPIEDGDTVIPGSTIYMGLIDDGTGNPGPVTIETLPERPATPDVTVNPYDYNMNTTTDMEYSLDGGETWEPCTDDMNVEDLQGETILVRIAATDDSFHSDPCTVEVPVRGPAPVLQIDNDTERMDCTAAMEYYDGTYWIPCLDDMSVSNMTGETIQVRYSCDGVNPASNPATVAIPTRNELPTFHFDMEAETLCADSALAQVMADGSWTAVDDGFDVSDKCGQGVLVRAKFDDVYFASLPETVTVPLRGETPAPVIDKETATIPNLTGCEYSTDDGATWTPTGSTLDVSTLAGETILIRRDNTESTFASAPVETAIYEYADAPDVELNTYDETINTTEDMDVSPDGINWTPATEPLDVSDKDGTEIYIRNHGDDDEFPSEPVVIVIPERRPAPEVDIDTRTETIQPTADTEYSIDGGETWTPADDPLSISDLTGETVLIREPATDDDFASKITTVIVPERPDGPVLILDPETETVNTTDEMEYSTDGGETWQPATEPLDVSDLTGTDILVRYPADDDTPASSTTTVHVPERRPAPDVTLDPNTGIISPSSGLEYSDDGGETWKPCPDPFDVSDLTGKDIIIREPATDTEPASEGTVIHIPERYPTPDATLDTDTETIDVPTGSEYSTDGGQTWQPAPDPLDVSDLSGQDVLIRIPGDDDHLASEPQTIHVPERPAAPVVGHTDETRYGREDGTITGATSEMEYRTENGTWTPAPDGTIKNLAPGTYEVRYSATDDSFASLIQTVTIAEGRRTSGSGGGSSSGTTEYTVRFNSNGGSSVSSETVDRNSTVDEPAEPTREGYTFVGWYTDSDLEDEYDFSTEVKKSFTLYAKWEKNSEETEEPSVELPTELSNEWMLNKKDHIAYITGRSADLAAPEANITRAEVAMILYRLLSDEAKAIYNTSSCSFADVASDAWYRTAVATLTNAGIIEGYDNGLFGPEDNITRAELATILARFCKADTASGDQFTDIAGHWARAYINTAAAAGLVQGYGDGTFGPDNAITRAETVAMVNRILERSASAATVLPGYKTFSDIEETDWFYWDIIEASNDHLFVKTTGTELWTKLN